MASTLVRRPTSWQGRSAPKQREAEEGPLADRGARPMGGSSSEPAQATAALGVYILVRGRSGLGPASRPTRPSPRRTGFFDNGSVVHGSALGRGTRQRGHKVFSHRCLYALACRPVLATQRVSRQGHGPAVQGRCSSQVRIVYWGGRAGSALLHGVRTFGSRGGPSGSSGRRRRAYLGRDGGTGRRLTRRLPALRSRDSHDRPPGA
jgi:hypothetical protein